MIDMVCRRLSEVSLDRSDLEENLEILMEKPVAQKFAADLWRFVDGEGPMAAVAPVNDIGNTATANGKEASCKDAAGMGTSCKEAGHEVGKAEASGGSDEEYGEEEYGEEEYGEEEYMDSEEEEEYWRQKELEKQTKSSSGLVPEQPVENGAPTRPLTDQLPRSSSGLVPGEGGKEGGLDLPAQEDSRAGSRSFQPDDDMQDRSSVSIPSSFGGCGIGCGMSASVYRSATCAVAGDGVEQTYLPAPLTDPQMGEEDLSELHEWLEEAALQAPSTPVPL